MGFSSPFTTLNKPIIKLFKHVLTSSTTLPTDSVDKKSVSRNCIDFCGERFITVRKLPRHFETREKSPGCG